MAQDTAKLANVEGRTVKSIRPYLDEENERHFDIQFTNNEVLDIRVKPNSDFVVEWMRDDDCLRENPFSESPMLNSDCLGKTEPTRASRASDLMRRRYQKGSIQQQNGSWTGRYLEYFVNEQGPQKFRQRRVYLGPVYNMTQKMAWRLRSGNL